MVAKIALFYGTQTSNTQDAAEEIQKAFGSDLVDLVDISSASAEDFQPYECLIIGCPTWDVGELQADWDGFFPELDEIDFTGKKVAYFGCGDQIGYGDNFQDAMGILEEKVAERGGKTVGLWPTTGYEFDASKAVRGEQFVGLALDNDNQSDLTDARIKQWVTQLKPQFGV